MIMPRNIFMSFLGTNDYKPCTYVSQDGFEKADTRFIQAALVEWRCRQWTEKDLVVIFLTDEAFRKNWENDGHGTRKDGSTSCQGLRQCLEELTLKVPVKPVRIPDGKSDAEIWDIFDQVYSVLACEDQVIMDITHAFRFIPMLAIVLLNYAKALKGISISGIHYGAFEVLGSLSMVDKMPLKKRRAPIFDLTAFDSLMAWSTGVDRFLSAGDASLISRLAKENIRPILAQRKGKDEAAKAIRGVSNAVDEFSRILSTCRGKEISSVATTLKSRVTRCLQFDVIKPFQPILQALSEKTAPFSGEVLSDGIRAAEWCLKHNMIQQGYTILLEVLVTWVASLYVPEKLELTEIEIRGIVSSAIHIAKHDTPEGEWKREAKKHPEITRRYINISRQYPALLDLYAPLTDFRNDLNHAGYSKKPKPSETIIKKLEEFVLSAKSLIVAG
jgi:CRISPR-associated Csx2 family protein